MKRYLLSISCLVLLMFCKSQTAIAAPEWPLKVMNGDGNYDIADHTGPFLLEFYFKGCSSCQQNAPNVAEVAAEYHGTRAQILEIGIDCDEQDYKDWIAAHPTKGLVLNGCDSDVIAKYSVERYPTTIVLKPNGAVAGRFVGVWSSTTKNRIKGLLNAKDSQETESSWWDWF